jgi:hypothetical protein
MVRRDGLLFKNADPTLRTGLSFILSLRDVSDFAGRKMRWVFSGKAVTQESLGLRPISVNLRV